MYRHNIYDKRDIQTAKSEIEYRIIQKETGFVLETYGTKKIAEVALYYYHELGYDCEIEQGLEDIEKYKYCQQF